MDTQEIIDALKQQRERLDQAIAALDGGSRGSTLPASRVASRPSPRGPRRMSAEARQKIAEAQKRRWAKVKAKQAATAGGTTKKK